MKAKPKLRNAIISNSDDDFIKTLAEISLNTLNGNNPIDNKTKNKLRCYKRVIRKLACSKRCNKSKRKLIIQKGGFLPMLIGTILSGVIGALFNKHNE